MVHVATPRPNLGSALGQGFQEAFSNEMDYRRNQSRLSEGLKQLESLSPEDRKDPYKVTSKLVGALGAVKGAERYIAPLSEMLTRRGAAETIYRPQGNAPSEVQPQGGGQPVIPQTQVEQAPPNVAIAGQPAPQGRSYSGVLPRVIPQEEINADAERIALSTGDPNQAKIRAEELNTRNLHAQQAIDNARNRLSSLGITPEELPQAMKIGERFSNYTDLDEWSRATQKAYQLYAADRDKIQKAFVPQFWNTMLTGKKGREEALKNLRPAIERGIKNGFEPEIRQDLLARDLSPTEVEGLIHPMPKNVEADLKRFEPWAKFRPKLDFAAGFPQETSIMEQINAMPDIKDQLHQNLVKFFEKNIDDKVSLLNLRHDLTMDKNVPWQMVGPAMREAMAKNQYETTHWQEDEMGEIETQAPRQSLTEIFQDWWRPFEYFKGKK